MAFSYMTYTRQIGHDGVTLWNAISDSTSNLSAQPVVSRASLTTYQTTLRIKSIWACTKGTIVARLTFAEGTPIRIVEFGGSSRPSEMNWVLSDDLVISSAANITVSSFLSEANSSISLKLVWRAD